MGFRDQVQPKLGWKGQSPLTVTESGLYIVAGEGLVPRTQAGELLLDATQADTPEVFSLFRPGTVAADTLGVWHNGRISGTAPVVSLEANLGTAPTASGDASNYWQIKLTDAQTTPNTLVLPISTLSTRHYFQGQASSLAIHSYTPGSGLVGTSSSTTVPVFMATFVPTADQTAVSVTLLGGVTASGYLTASIADSTGAVIAVGSIYLVGGAVDWVTIPFQLAVPLKQAQTYAVALDSIGNGSVRLAYNTSGNATGYTPGVDGSWNDSAYPGDAGGGVTVQELAAQLIATGYGSTYGADWTFNTSPLLFGGGAHAPSFFGINTAQTASVLYGDITATIEAVGTPPAGSAGADLNFRALIAA